jgi:hypothetical protein
VRRRRAKHLDNDFIVASLRSENLNPRKRISLDERHSLTVYSRNMHNDSDLYNGNDSDDDMYARFVFRTSRGPV